ncbi:GIY-YIG nuclease family protein [Azospirillum sp.]|uniref:GIY-YIG nuclease family protein n=1 Tax=Azospirillum sp. TaxID=34012 RepID=UPI0039C87F3D
MAQITVEQRRFLAEQKIPLSIVFDATGMKTADYRIVMKQLGKHFAYGVTPCQKGGHSLKSRSGQCIQCNTANIAFQLRNYKNGFVYLAGSPSIKILKVGVTSDLEARIRMLNHYRYGEAGDWEYLISTKTENAGAAESKVHSLLGAYSIDGYYYREGRRTQCYELFRCSYVTARSALTDTVPERNYKIHSLETRSQKIYW